ncbi:MAG TPA: hypothetical protein P5522_09595 [Spirochaetia bacterium]|nr:hypothetical protein [Spirochaetia bacterium]
MSFTKKAEMAKQAAFDVMASTVYNPIFFAKLAQYGIVPQTEQEAADLLKAASNVRAAALETFGDISHGVPDAGLVKEAYNLIKQDSRIKSAAVILAYQE